MKINVLTLFPDVFNFLKDYGVIGNAIKDKKADIDVINIRNFSLSKHKKVDDTVFGGMPGMLMTPQPIVDAIEHIKTTQNTHVIFLGPQGKVFNQKKAIELSQLENITFLCGHYEGIDARVYNYVDEEISIGDYVLTGGEIPCLTIIDSVVRLIDGVLGNNNSASTDSHWNYLLQHDEYTKPRNFRGYCVPEILFSGNHKLIREWNLKNSIEKTKKLRPDLYEEFLKLKDY